MDFLLECIGFPPNHDLGELARLARSQGEPVAWRGPQGEHLRLPLADGLDLRMDREEGSPHWSLYPQFATSTRMRMAIDHLRSLPDSPFDALVIGWANPPLEGEARDCAESFPLSALLTDRRRLPKKLAPHQVLAVALAGFALDVEHVGPGPLLTEARAVPEGARRFEDGGWIAPLGGATDPGGCVDLSLRVLSLRHMRNPVTDASVTLVEVATPDRPLTLFSSPWQLEVDRLPEPRIGWFVQGTFLLTGRIAGGLTSPVKRLGRNFG